MCHKIRQSESDDVNEKIRCYLDSIDGNPVSGVSIPSITSDMDGP